MATFDETLASAYADPGGVIESYKSLISPSNIPTGANLAPGFTGLQTGAANLLQSGLGSYQPFLAAGAQSLNTGMASTGPGGAQPYLNPYLQNVANTTMTDLNRLFGQQQATQTQKQIQSGSFAGSGTRGAVFDAELQRNQGDVAAKALSGLYAGGYESALKAAQQAGKTQAGIGQIYGGLGKQAQAGLMGDVSGLFDMGEAQRQITGAQNLATYQTPFYGLGQFSSALRGAPTFQQYQSPSPILTGIGAATGIANMYG